MRKKHIKKSIILFLVTALTVSLITTGIWALSLSDDEAMYRGSDCTTNKTAAAAIDYIISKYPQGAEYPGSGQCWGYAEKVSSIIAASRSVEYHTDLRFNKTNFKKYCLNAKAGTHLRLSREKSFNAWSGHSIALFKVTDQLVCWADNNYSWQNTVAYHFGTLDDFLSYYGQYGYINMIAKTTSYKKSETPGLASALDNAELKVNLYWTSVAGATGYSVYRSTSKDGKYSYIGSTKNCSFSYSNAPIGKPGYYKVKAKTESGSKWSGVTYKRLKLATPDVNTNNDPATGYIQVYWTPVKGADKYRVYRYSNKLGKFVLNKTTTECTFTDTKATDVDRCYEYKVKAVYDEDSKGNSNYSYSSYNFYEPVYYEPVDDNSGENGGE